jgi:hypothetical protein
MASQDSSAAFIKEYQDRFEKKLKENEITLLEHWKGQLDKDRRVCGRTVLLHCNCKLRRHRK